MSKESKRPSIFARLSSQGSTNDSTTNVESHEAPPPAYDAINATDATAAEAASKTAAFQNLRLHVVPADPDVDTCLAHLKLLFAIQWMKEDVGFADGLWGLWDARVGPISPVLKGRPEKEKKGKDADEREPSPEEKVRAKNLKALSQIREKRWALFVARAVDRYETWWKSLMAASPSRPLSEADMEIRGFPMFEGFPTDQRALMWWLEDMLPPLGMFFPAPALQCKD
jgi:hypothetical protein